MVWKILFIFFKIINIEFICKKFYVVFKLFKFGRGICVIFFEKYLIFIKLRLVSKYVLKKVNIGVFLEI